MAEVTPHVTVTVTEAAGIVGVSPEQIHSWIKEGRIKAELVRHKLGPTYRIIKATLPKPSDTKQHAETTRQQHLFFQY